MKSAISVLMIVMLTLAIFMPLASATSNVIVPCRPKIVMDDIENVTVNVGDNVSFLVTGQLKLYCCETTLSSMCYRVPVIRIKGKQMPVSSTLTPVKLGFFKSVYRFNYTAMEEGTYNMTFVGKMKRVKPGVEKMTLTVVPLPEPDPDPDPEYVPYYPAVGGMFTQHPNGCNMWARWNAMNETKNATGITQDQINEMKLCWFELKRMTNIAKHEIKMGRTPVLENILNKIGR